MIRPDVERITRTARRVGTVDMKDLVSWIEHLEGARVECPHAQIIDDEGNALCRFGTQQNSVVIERFDSNRGELIRIEALERRSEGVTSEP